jgi:uncharacterized protein (DUF1697 family)
MAKHLALLRAVNVGGRKLPMAELRALCAELGWSEVETYIQSGNIAFAAKGNAAALETELEEAILKRFKLEVPVVVRSASQWSDLAESNPFVEAAEKEPNRVQLLISKRPPAADAPERLMDRAQDGETVRLAGGGLWFHYPEGVARSKLTPSLIDKTAGSPTTGRNWRTVLTLRGMLQG